MPRGRIGTLAMTRASSQQKEIPDANHYDWRSGRFRTASQSGGSDTGLVPVRLSQAEDTDDDRSEETEAWSRSFFRRVDMSRRGGTPIFCLIGA